MKEVMNQDEKEENEKKLIKLGYERCENCKKLSKKIKEIGKDGKKLCSNCKRKEVTNKWYNPLAVKKNIIGRFSLSDAEIKIRIGQLIRSGMSRDEARKRVYGNLKYMRKMKWNRRRKYHNERISNKIKQEDSKENMKRFLERLK